MKKCESWQEVVASVEDDVHLLCCHLEVQVWLKLPFSPYQKPSHDESIIQFKNLSSRFWPDVKNHLAIVKCVPWKVVSIYSRLFKAAPTIVAPNFFVEAGRPLLKPLTPGTPGVETRRASKNQGFIPWSIFTFMLVTQVLFCEGKLKNDLVLLIFFIFLLYSSQKEQKQPNAHRGTTFNRSCSVAIHFWTPECRSWPSVSPHGHL